jgi:hypothetical protein
VYVFPTPSRGHFRHRPCMVVQRKTTLAPKYFKLI